jgi:hypothetical protein
MDIETFLLATMVFGGGALAMVISFVCAKCEDEARRMVHDNRQVHYGSATE